MPRLPWIGSLAAVVLMMPGAASADTAALGVLLDGISALPAKQPVNGLASFGERSFPVATGFTESVPSPAMCAARWRNGRVVVFGGRSLLDSGPESGRLLANAIRWCAGDHRDGLVAVVGDVPSPSSTESGGHRVVRWSVDDLRQRMEAPDFEVVVVESSLVAQRDGKRMSEFLTAFVKGGGGLIVVGNHAPAGPDSLSSPSTNRLENRMLAPMGIGWTGRPVAPGASPNWSTDPAVLARACGRRALQGLWDSQLGKDSAGAPQTQTVATVAFALLAAPREEGWFVPRVARYVERWASRKPAPWGPDQSADKLRAVLAWRRTVQVPPPPDRPVSQPGNPFPAVPRPPGALMSSRVADVRIPGGFTGVLGTGLAALPGQRLTLVATAGGPAVRLRVGEHPALPFSSPVWERFPEIRMEMEMLPGKPVVPVFGGPISLVIDRALGAGDTHVRLIGADPARIDDGFVAGPLWRETVRGPIRLVAPPGVAVPPDSPQWDHARALAASVRRSVRPGLPEPGVLALDPAGVGTGRWVGIAPAVWDLLRRPESSWTRLVFAEAVAAAGPEGAPGGWERFGSAVATVAAVGDDLPGSQAAERVATRAQVAGGPPAPNPMLILEMILQIRETLGASAFDAIRNRVPSAEADPAVWWVAFGDATGKDLRPFWKAYGMPIPAALEARNTTWQPWSGASAPVGNTSSQPGQP